MRFDDRLSTVLGLSADAPRDRAVQWRQLVELLARGAGAADPVLRDHALARIAELGREVPDGVRVAAARAIAGPDVPLALLRLFLDHPETAAPLLAAAELDADGWAEVRERASPGVQALVDTLRPAETKDAGHPRSVLPPGTPAEPETAEPVLTDLPGLFRWECGPTGEIDWVEGVPRAALIGRSVADDFQQRFAARLPFDNEPLVLSGEGLLAGEWRWSGTPTFFPDTGRFAGYRGEARRGDPAAALNGVTGLAGVARLESDRLRELIHEVRTPLNAIIGFGEIIEGQVMGPAHRAYRDRAAEIVRQARRLLGAVDDLDLAAKLQSGRKAGGQVASVAEVLEAVSQNLQPLLARRRVTLALPPAPENDRLAMDGELARRLLQRWVEAVAASAGAGELLSLAVRREGAALSFTLVLPDQLRDEGAQTLFDPAFTPQAEQGLGTGFSLRLLRGLAATAGGGVDVLGGALVLRLPVAGA